jgi:hypothetical protein
MPRPAFTGSFTQQLPIPDVGVDAAVAVMRSGRLHRYDMASGEDSEVMALEREYAAWQGARYDRVAGHSRGHEAIALPNRPEVEGYVGSSIQFMIPDIAGKTAERLIATAAAVGVELKWFGAAVPVGFTPAHQSWRYMSRQKLPRTDRILSDLFDMRLPLTFTLEDCDLIAEHILESVSAVLETA